MKNKIYTATRNTQIIINKKFDVRSGDKIEVIYNKDNDGKIISGKIKLNEKDLGEFDLSEIEEFLSVFFSEEF